MASWPSLGAQPRRGTATAPNARSNVSRHHRHRRAQKMCVVTMMEQRRVRSNEVLASTTGRRSRGGDALIVSRAISMSPGSSDENDSQEMVNIRAQFSQRWWILRTMVKRISVSVAIEIRRRRAAGESTPRIQRTMEARRRLQQQILSRRLCKKAACITRKSEKKNH